MNSPAIAEVEEVMREAVDFPEEGVEGAARLC